MRYISVAVDGPAGAGKSSVSKAVAKDLGYVYIDTGAMYRSVALFAKQNNIDVKNDAESLILRLNEIDISMKNTNEGQKIFLNGDDVTGEIRSEEISAGASAVATIPQVRKRLVGMQKKMAEGENVIMDGRDICTSVLPNATVKVYLTASVGARAKRRCEELREKGVDCDYESVERDIRARDFNDMNRKESPLRQAEDAVLMDTSDIDFSESVARLKDLILAAL